MYYFVNWKETEDGKMADLPEEVDYLMLAEPSAFSDYALFECFIPDEYENLESVDPVSNYLHDLLESAKDYPPAMALARKDVRENQIVSKEELAAYLISRLEFYFQQQRSSPYFMARKNNRQISWNSNGRFYWIIGYNPKNTLGSINFVSCDYYVCHASIEDFDVELTEMEKRFACF